MHRIVKNTYLWGIQNERLTNSLIRTETRCDNSGIEIMKTSAQTIVAFHTGRGGRFYNAGHVSFIGERRIDEFTNDLFLNFENEAEILNTIGDRTNLLKKFEECRDKEDFSFFKKLGLDAGEQIYTDCNGNSVGLTLAEAKTGVGCINIDDEYNTTCAMYLEDCSENELQLIVDYDGYVDSDVLAYVKEALGIEDEEIED